MYGKRWKVANLEKEKMKYEKHFEETNERPQIYPSVWNKLTCNSAKKVDAITYLEDKINELQQSTSFADPVCNLCDE